MRILSLLSITLLLFTACEESPFESAQERCENQLFPALDSRQSNSPSLRAIADSDNYNGTTSDSKLDFITPEFITSMATADVATHRYVIENKHNTIQGQFTEVDIITINDGQLNDPIGGFDFLIKYEAHALAFMGAEPGTFIDNCEWEYFTYRTGPFVDCGDQCPSGLVRIVGVAETNNGANHPIGGCTNTTGNEQVAILKFLTSSDPLYECQFVPIRFFWLDCQDNSVSDESGENLYWGRQVFDYNGQYNPEGGFDIRNYSELITPYGADHEFPSIYGPNSYCDSLVDTTAGIFDYIDFFNGGVNLVCADLIDSRGDINLDGLSYTVSDAVMFSNYFIEDLPALVYIDELDWQGNPVGYSASVAATDINSDGQTLTLPDFVYLIRIILGDALPFPKMVAGVDAVLTIAPDGDISIDSEMGAAFLKFSGDITPILLADNMDMKYGFDGTDTRVLVWSFDRETFIGEFLHADSGVTYVELATPEGAYVNLFEIPTDFTIEEDMLNPYTGRKVIRVGFPLASEYSVWIYSLATCEIVATFQGSSAAGYTNIVWEYYTLGLDPGEYVFRMTVGEFTESITLELESLP